MEEKWFKISFTFPAIPIPLREENSLPLSVAKPGQSRRMCVASHIASQNQYLVEIPIFFIDFFFNYSQ